MVIYLKQSADFKCGLFFIVIQQVLEYERLIWKIWL